jgi:hypothetical protein
MRFSTLSPNTPILTLQTVANKLLSLHPQGYGSQLLGKTLFGSADLNYIWHSMSKPSEIPTGVHLTNLVPQCHGCDLTKYFATFAFDIPRCCVEEKEKATLGASSQYCQFFDASSSHGLFCLPTLLLMKLCNLQRSAVQTRPKSKANQQTKAISSGFGLRSLRAGFFIP